MEREERKEAIWERAGGLSIFSEGPVDDAVVHRNLAEPHDLPWNLSASGSHWPPTSDRRLFEGPHWAYQLGQA